MRLQGSINPKHVEMGTRCGRKSMGPDNTKRSRSASSSKEAESARERIFCSQFFFRRAQLSISCQRAAQKQSGNSYPPSQPARCMHGGFKKEEYERMFQNIFSKHFETMLNEKNEINCGFLFNIKLITYT